MANNKESGISELPQWPDDAKEVSGGGPLRETFYALYIGGAIGAVLGLFRALPILLMGDQMNAEQFGYATGSVIVPALVGLFIGYLIDRRRWNREWDRRH